MKSGPCIGLWEVKGLTMAAFSMAFYQLGCCPRLGLGKKQIESPLLAEKSDQIHGGAREQGESRFPPGLLVFSSLLERSDLTLQEVGC